MAHAHRLSIFSQSLTYVTYMAYILGGLVPLMALAGVLQHYVFPTLQEDRAAYGLIGLIVSIGMLSLGAFLTLRRLTLDALGRMGGRNDGLETVVRAARNLSATSHRDEAAQIIAACAQRLVRGRAAFVVMAGPEKEPVALGHAGEAALFDPYAAAIGRALGDAGSAAGGTEPFECIPMDLETKGGAAIVLIEAPEPAGDLVSMLAALGAVGLRNAQLNETQRNFFVQLTDLLTTSLDQHMDYHQGHSRRVAHVANRIGRTLGFNDHRLERLHFASLLHDLGMLRIPPGQHEDKRTVRAHSTLGHRMLQPIHAWADLAPFVLHHHEWFDGSGYPAGLAGEAIPLESRIIGLAEAVDSMTSSTSYKPALSKENAFAEVRDGAGSQFDPEIARVFLDLVEAGDLDLQSS
jgi:HD-GYP domain-containing protein (c-di-GMP phosphodiesterase class II)